jgi:hypothetical protein
VALPANALLPSRTEKKVLNEMNHAPMDKGGPKYPIPGTGNKAVKERVGSPLEKIFLLVRDGSADQECTGLLH